jgi:hypothetical protein
MQAHVCAAGLVALSAIGCGGDASPASPAAPAQTSIVPRASRIARAPSAALVAAAAAHDATLARRWALPGRSFAPGEAGLSTPYAPARASTPVAVAHLDDLDRSAQGTGALRVAIDDDPEVSLTLLPEGASQVAPELEDGRVVLRDVHPATDAVHLATASGAELLYVLRDASAPTTFAWSARRGRTLADVRDDGDGGLSFVDARGHERLYVARPFAVDARGVRREAELRWSDGRLSVALDPTGLAYPIVLDPYIGTARWQRLKVAPGARYSTSMTDVGGKLVVFGGQGTTVLGDTWSWDGQRWTEVLPTTSPAPRAGAAFGALGGRGILFGGVDATLTKRLDETWAFDGATWTQLSPAHHPPGSVYASLAHVGSKLVLLGGKPPSGSTWLFDGSDWSENTSSPQPSFDPGGTVGVFADDGTLAYYVGDGETWTFDGAAWTDRSATAATPHRPAFLGRIGSQLVLWAAGEGYLWSGSAWTLRPHVDLPPKIATASQYAATSYGGAIAFFGGRSFTGSLDAFLRLDAGGWSRPSNHAVPDGRVLACFASVGTQAVLFGGYGDRVLGDTWEFDGKAWTSKSPASAPSARYRPACADGGDVALLFGGGADTPTNETWTWDHSNWTHRTPATTPPADAVPHAARIGSDDVLLAGARPYRWSGTDWTLGTAKVPTRTGFVTGQDWSVFTSYAGQGLLVVPELGTQWSYDGSAFTKVDAAGISGLGGPGITSPLLGNSGFDLGTRALVIGTRLGANATESWLWDGASWAQLGNDGLPSLSLVNAAKVGGQVALFGGFDDGAQTSSETYLLQVTLANGVACGGDVDCESGHCAKGVCCNTACGEAAQSCTLPATRGTCAPVLAACVDASRLQAADGSTSSCAPYLCVASACLHTCGSSSDCVGGYSCDDTRSCAQAAPQGASSSGCGLSGERADWTSGGAAAVTSLVAALALHARRRRRLR